MNSKYTTVLNISGGATKITGLFGGARAILENDKPDLITGISSGAILAVPLALGLFTEIEKIVLNLSMKDMFIVNPYKDNNKLSLSALWRVITGKPSLGTSNIISTLKKLITAEKFDIYKYGSYPDVEIGVVDFTTGDMLYYKVKDLNYTDYLSLTLASSSIPIIHAPVYFKDKVLYDGGVREHIGSLHTLETYNPKLCYNVYSRPKDNQILSTDWKLKDIVSVLDRTQQIQFTELEKRSDRYLEVIMKDRDTQIKSVYLPRILDGLFDIEKDRLKQLYEEGYQEGLSLFK